MSKLTPLWLVAALTSACADGPDSSAADDPPQGDGGAVDQDGGASDGGAVDQDGGAAVPDGGAEAEDGGAGGGSDGGSDGGSADTGDDGGDGPLVLSGSAEVLANPHNPFSAIVELSLDHDAELSVSYGGGELDHRTPTQTVRAGETAQVLVLGLRAGRDFRLQVEAIADDDGEEATWTSDELSYSTEPLPDGWPACSVSFEADPASFDPDEVLCSAAVLRTGQRIHSCTDYWGDPVLALSTDANDTLLSMRPLHAGGWVGTSNTNSTVLLFDQAGATTAEFAAPDFATGARFEHQSIDAHDAIEIKQGPWTGAIVALTVATEYLPDHTTRRGNGIVVFDPDTGEVLYDYSFHGVLGDDEAMDPLVPYSRIGTGDVDGDWIHANAVLHGIDSDGRDFFLLSLKAQDWLVKLYPDSDEIDWRLGFEGDLQLVSDVDLDEPEPASPLDWAYHQHGPSFVQGGPLVDPLDGRLHLLMLDNGYPRNDGSDYRWDMTYSRVLQLDVDEARGMADIDFQWGAQDPDSPDWFYTQACGSAELTQDGTRVVALDGESGTRFELSYPDGLRRWSMTCELAVDLCEYRVLWYPSVYELNWSYD